MVGIDNRTLVLIYLFFYIYFILFFTKIMLSRIPGFLFWGLEEALCGWVVGLIIFAHCFLDGSFVMDFGE
jgi:hypothetical protein